MQSQSIDFPGGLSSESVLMSTSGRHIVIIIHIVINLSMRGIVVHIYMKPVYLLNILPMLVYYQ